MKYCTANLIGQWTPKISHGASGKTPNKPTEKLARDSRKNIRGPLDFSSENVENLENLEPLVNIGGLVSLKIQRRRSGGSPIRASRLLNLLLLFLVS